MSDIGGTWRFRRNGEVAPEGSISTSMGWLMPVNGPVYQAENLLKEAILLLDSISPGDNGWDETLGLRGAVAEVVEVGVKDATASDAQGEEQT